MWTRRSQMARCRPPSRKPAAALRGAFTTTGAPQRGARSLLLHPLQCHVTSKAPGVPEKGRVPFRYVDFLKEAVLRDGLVRDPNI
jgi:hypothetical protein